MTGRAALRFSGADRHADEENELRLTSVGIDIGSSTTHLVFSLLRLERRGSRYVTVERRVLRQSDIALTPFAGADGSVIDGPALREFIDGEYSRSGLSRSDVDTGALILTGLAVRRDNAREIGDVFAEEAGRFVMVTAGDGLEATMAAFGSGAVAASEQAGTCLNVDIGGGTTKFALCRDGRVEQVTAVDIGARVVLRDTEGLLTRVEPAARYVSGLAGVTVETGAVMTDQDLAGLVAVMADVVFEVATAGPDVSDDVKPLLRLPPLAVAGAPAQVVFSGGVSEFIYGREPAEFGDLGPLLAAALTERFERLDASVLRIGAGIRATAMGASQHTIQLSGSTIFVDPAEVLPLRNIPVVAPQLELEKDELDARDIGEAISADLARLQGELLGTQAAIALRWGGSATYRRLTAFCQGLVHGMQPVLANGHPLVLLSEGDVGGLLGMHLRDSGLANPVISVDGVDLKEFDYIDVGAIVPGSGAVPVVIKSLVFPAPQEFPVPHRSS